MTTIPQRIVSLLSSNTEMACALGLEDRLVGISHECDWPETILDRPRLTATRVDGESASGAIHEQVGELLRRGLPLYSIDEAKLRAAEPDLILTQAQCEVCAVDYDEVRAAVEKMPRGKRPAILSFQPELFQDVTDDLERLGRAAGVVERATALVEKLQARRRRVEFAVREARRRPRVLTLEWLDPPMPGGCWTPQLVELAGGRHLLNPPGRKTRKISWKQVAESQAEILVVAPCGFGLGQTTREIPALLARSEIRKLPAFEQSRIFIADGCALFNRPGPRLFDTLELLAHIIHPERARIGGVPCPQSMSSRISITDEGVRAVS